MTRILVVDDDADMRRLAKRALELGGFTVDTVGNGLAALQAVRLSDFGVVLMDLRMPELSGIETAARIRAWEGATGRQPHLIIPFSSEPANPTREQRLAHDMVGYVTKPFEPEGLLRTVRHSLGQSAARHDAGSCL